LRMLLAVCCTKVNLYRRLLHQTELLKDSGADHTNFG
jgi:hypothetical protein